MKKIQIEDKIAFLIIIIASVLRVHNYADWSLSNDELSAMARLQFQSFGEMIEKGVRLNDMHPVGVQTFLWFWTHLFGISVAVFRLPFVIAGIASVIVFYKIAKLWFNKTAALFALCLFSMLQFPILYSQLARPYSPGLFFSLLFVLAWTHLLFRDKTISIVNVSKRKWFVIFILSGVSCMYTHYFSFMFAGIVGLTGILFLNKADFKWYLLAGIIMFLFYIPNLNIFIYQFSIGGLGGEGGWLGAPKSTAIADYIYYCLDESPIVFFTCLILIIGSLARYLQNNKLRKFHVFSFLFFLLPALIAYFYSIWKNPVFQYSILLFSFPYLLLMICSFIPEMKWSLKEFIAVLGLTALLLYSTIYENKFYSTEYFADFKRVAERSAQLNKIYSPDSVLNTMNVISPFYIDYYLKKNDPLIRVENYKADNLAGYLELNSLASKSEKQFFLHGWANTYHGPEIDQTIQQYFPYKVEEDLFFNSGLTLYSKSSVKGNINKSIAFADSNSFEKPKWSNDSLFEVNGNAHSGEYAMELKESQEFGPTFSSSSKEMHLEKSSTIQISCWVNGFDNLKDASFVLSVNRQDKSVLYRSVSLKDFANAQQSWNKVFLSYVITEDILPDDEVKVYIWNSGKQLITADDIQIRVLN